MKNVLSLVVFLMLVLGSCTSRTYGEKSENTTLKYMAANLDSITEWTESVDAGILEEKLSVVKGISDSMEISVGLLPLSKGLCEGRRIFPAIKDGFSLDVSSLPSQFYDCIDGFCKTFIDGSQPDGFFERTSIYSLIMFKYDFQRLYGDRGIAWYAIGEPFVSEDFYVFPVRFFLGDGEMKTSDSEKKNFNDAHADVQVCCKKSGAALKIVSVDLLMRESVEAEN